MKKIKRLLRDLRFIIRKKISGLRFKMKYGVFVSELWNLDETMIELLYKRLKVFKDVCPMVEDNIVKYYDGREVPWEKAVDALLEKILAYWKLSHEGHFFSEEREEKKDDIWFDWIQIQSYMWF